MTTDSSKVLIVGTGVSALLLARSLLSRNVCTSLTLIGPRQRIRPYRLSYWSDSPTPFDDHCDMHWSTLSVIAADGREMRSPLERHAYRSFKARAWAEAWRSELQSDARVRFVEEPVLRVEDQTVAASAYTERERMTADWVFVSGGPLAFAPDAWQRFCGWEIEASAASVDMQSARLLDFRTEAAHDFRFVYLLPLGPQRFFVEHVSYQPCDYDAALGHYLRDVLGLEDWRLVQREKGETPLYRQPPPRNAGRVVRIGVHAGLAKASTGYALTRMWRDAEAIATALAAGGQPAGEFASGPFYTMADRLFMDLLAKEPTRLSELMLSLFSGATGDQVLGFLDDDASMGAQLNVARALPPWLSWSRLRDAAFE